MNYKELVDYMVKSLVDHPDQVEIREVEGEKSTILELRVTKEDIGKVIGKHERSILDCGFRRWTGFFPFAVRVAVSARLRFDGFRSLGGRATGRQ